MRSPSDENIDGLYRTPGHVYAASAKVSSVNEENYDTLKIVKEILDSGVQGLYKDFNAFRMAEGVGKKVTSEDIVLQIAARKIAYDILMPVQEAVNSAVQQIEEKYKGRG